MYIPEELKKVNAFIDVAIPSNKQYFSRLGQTLPADTQYTGDEVATMSKNKVDQIADYEAYAEMMASDSNK